MIDDADRTRGTEWSLLTVPQMWSMLAPHDGTAHKNLLVTWKKSADLLIDHWSRVKRYRENLADAWPPERSKASAKYLERLDDLIAHIIATHHATVENHHALGAATSSLVGTRRKLAAITEEYTANQATLNAYASRLQDNATATGKWRAALPHPPAAAEARQRDLQLQAQHLMSTLSTDLAQAQLLITNPQLYNPQNRLQDSEPFNSGAAERPSLTGTSSANVHPAQKLINPSTALPDQGLFAPRPDAPILSSIEQSKTSLTPISTAFTPPTGRSNSIGDKNEQLPMYRQPGSTRSGLGFPAESKGESTRGGRGMLPGGIIGTSPGTDNTRPGTNIPKTQKVNPPGGVIGQPGLVASPPVPRWDKSHAPEYRKQHWDLDNPWATGEGVAPILLPSEKKKIDPGPVIGLS
ncbi:hypothetical protein [Actinoplanes awajinensis]|uniref:hypothetical protein n=1 Tax=Actinoplanes awajinensis TaxID=135946 RepID=UPI000A633344|nr:hypothetical protein [Actinoplanes awajinensis]